MHLSKKNKQRLIALACIVGGLVLLWLLLRKSPAASSSQTGAPITLGGNSYTTPGALNPPTYSPPSFLGGNTTVGGTNVGAPVVNLGSPGDDNCECQSCGCSPESSAFAGSVQGALNSYSAAMAQLEQNQLDANQASIPAFMAQYVAIADPNAPGGLNG